MKKRWYRAYFVANINSEKYYPAPKFFDADDDMEAVKIADSYASDGLDYSGQHYDLEVVSVTMIDW